MASALYHVDSRYRASGTPGSYTYPLEKHLRHVTNIEVVYGEVPSSSFPFQVGDDLSEWGFGRDRTNTIHATLTGTVGTSVVSYERFIRLTPGKYTGEDFADHIQTELEGAAWDGTLQTNRRVDGVHGFGVQNKPAFVNVTYNEATSKLSIARNPNHDNQFPSSESLSNVEWTEQSLPYLVVTNLTFHSFPPSTGLIPQDLPDGATMEGNRSVEIMSAPVAFLVIKNVKFRRANHVANETRIPSAGRGQLARFQLTAPYGSMNYFNSEHLLEHGEVEEPCATNIDHLEIEWFNRDGDVINFNGVDHTLQLRISHS
jgi:hypothetical protein